MIPRASRRLRPPPLDRLESRALPSVLADPGFESPDVGRDTDLAFAYNPADSPWTFSGPAGVAGNASGFTAGNPVAPEGGQVLFLQGAGAAEQAFHTDTPGPFAVTFRAAQRGNYQPTSQQVRVRIDGVLAGTAIPAGPAYQAFALPVALAAGPHTLALVGDNPQGDLNTAFVDAVDVVPQAPPVAGPLREGGFEAPDVGRDSYSAFVYNPAGSVWTFAGPAGVAGDGSGFTAGNPTAPEGGQVLFLQGSGSAAQSFAADAAGTYTLSFEAAQRGNYQPGYQEVQVRVDGNLAATVHPAGPDYETFAFDVTLAAGPHTLILAGLNPQGDLNTAFVDAVRIDPGTVEPPPPPPEPPPADGDPGIDPDPLALQTVIVTTRLELFAALAGATPGTHILLAPGFYGGDVIAVNLQGTAAAPIVIGALDPASPPEIGSAGEGLKLTDAAHVVLRDLKIHGNAFNGINIDDGGSYATPSHHVTIARCTISLTDSGGGDNAIKLSGVDNFRVVDCVIDDWGNGGDGIDGNGCHDGLIAGNFFRDSEGDADGGIQFKANSARIEVRDSFFFHAGVRAVQFGGSSPPGNDRPAGGLWEVQDMAVHDNVIIGSETAASFASNGPGCSFTHNTVVDPTVWLARVLQEDATSPPQAGEIGRNIVVFAQPAPWAAIQLGFFVPGDVFAPGDIHDNFWFNTVNPAGSAPALPTAEVAGVYGLDPLFVDTDPAVNNYHLQPGSPAQGYGIGG